MSPKGSVDESIFYKENKTPEEAKIFWKIFLRKFEARIEEIEVEGRKIKRLVFEEPVIAPGFVFPKTPNDFGWFINYTDNSGRTWEGRNPFENAVFKKEAIFYKAVFEGPISFKGAIFGGETRDTVKVLQNIPLGRILLQRDELPKEIEIGARFDEAIFLDVATFKNAVFKSSVSFSDTVFKKGALFDGCKFLGKQADFSNSKFYRVEQKDLQDSTLVLGADGLAFSHRSHLKVGACFNGAIFRCESRFTKSEIEGGLFENAYFKEAYFINTVFTGPAYFERSVFEYFSFVDVIFIEIVKFDNAKFIGKLYRIDNTQLQFLKPNLTQGSEYYKRRFKAEFMKSVSFEGIFSSVIIDFSHSRFHGYVSYNNAHFIYGLECHYCEFNGTVTGYFAKFQTYIILKSNIKDSRPYFETLSTSFAHSIFKETAMFIGANFGKVFFNFAVFEKGASFKNVKFYNETQFKEVEFKKAVEFQAVEFKGKTTFEGSVFERLAVFTNEKLTLDEPTPKFHDELSFANCDFRQGADFLGSLKNETNLSKLWEFFSSRFSNPQAMIEALRVQRLSFEKEGKRDEADRMFVLEMRARRRARLQNARNKFEWIKARVYNFVEWLLADLPSEYGTNWVRLFLFSLLVIIGNAVPYTIWSKLIDGFPENSSYFIRFLNALYYSLVTFTTLGYGDMHPTGWLKALSAIEALTGAVFMALIVAVIARKWMR